MKNLKNRNHSLPIFSITEMFEHMKNYGALMAKIANWLNPGGQLFVHIFTHKQFAYHFEKGLRTTTEIHSLKTKKKLNCFFAGWMAKTFFTGGTMPSHDLLLHFQEDLQIVQRWVVNGQHYSKTLEAWLKKLDANIKQIWPILETTYGNSLSSELFGSAFFTILSRVAFFCYSE